jgi:ribosomal protein S18 acetylase RimI-like enzyme
VSAKGAASAQRLVRPMNEADIPDAASISAEAFDFDISAPSARARWEERVRHSLRTDPGGAFVAERDGQIVGIAEAIVRDRTWVLSLLTVSSATGGRGDGRALLDAALDYGAQRTDAGLIVASNDPRAMRLYASCGFRLEPTFEAVGPPDASLIPPPDPAVTAVAADELESLAEISRAVRGAEQTPELQYIQSDGATILRLGDRGFTVVRPNQGIWGLCALDEEAARTLLWCALHWLRDDPKVHIEFFTGAQQWVLPILLAARIPFRAYGALAHRGVAAPLYPYIPSPAFA